MAGTAKEITMSMVEWEQVQKQLLKLRNDVYEVEQKKQKEVSSLKEKLSKKEEELDLHKEMVASASSHQEELISSKSEISSLKKENQGLLRSLQHLTEQNQANPGLTRAVSEKPKENSQHAQQQQQLQQKIDTLLKEIEEKEKNYQKNLKLKEEKITKLEGEKLSLQEQGDKVIEKFSEIMLSNDKYKDEIRTLEEKLKKQQESFGNLIQEHQKRIQSENEKQNDILEKEKSKIKNLENENSSLKENVARLTSEAATLSEINQLQSSQIDSFKASIGQITEDGANSDKKLKELIKKNNTLRRNLSEKDKQIEEFQLEIQELHEMKNKYEILLSHHELINGKFTNLTTKYDSMNTKFNEMEKLKGDLEKLNIELKSQIDTLKQENEFNQKRATELDQSLIDQIESLAKKDQELDLLKFQLIQIPQLQSKLSEITQSLETETQTHQTTKKSIQDKEMAHKIEQRQNAILIKQLQNQIKTLQGLGGPVSDPAPVSTPPPSTPPHRNPSRVISDSPQVMTRMSSRSEAKSGSGGRTTPAGGRISERDEIVSSASAPPDDKKGNHHPLPPQPEENLILENDVLVMGLKLGMLQQENFELEQQNQALKSDLRELREESAKKSRVIAKQLRGVKQPKTDNFWSNENNKPKSSGDAALSFVGSFFNSTTETPLQEERNNKMEAVLEETLLRNIQLQDDIRNIATDLEKLTAENKSLKQKLNNI